MEQSLSDERRKNMSSSVLSRRSSLRNWRHADSRSQLLACSDHHLFGGMLRSHDGCLERMSVTARIPRRGRCCRRLILYNLHNPVLGSSPHFETSFGFSQSNEESFRKSRSGENHFLQSCIIFITRPKRIKSL